MHCTTARLHGWSNISRCCIGETNKQIIRLLRIQASHYIVARSKHFSFHTYFPRIYIDTNIIKCFGNTCYESFEEPYPRRFILRKELEGYLISLTDRKLAFRSSSPKSVSPNPVARMTSIAMSWMNLNGGLARSRLVNCGLSIISPSLI